MFDSEVVRRMVRYSRMCGEPDRRSRGRERPRLSWWFPLYIPPYVIATKDEAAYRDFEKRMADAAKRHDFMEYDRLSMEQLKLGKFRPSVQHSFEERATTIVFHAQMLADFNTVDEIGRKMLEELAVSAGIPVCKAVSAGAQE